MRTGAVVPYAPGKLPDMRKQSCTMKEKLHGQAGLVNPTLQSLLAAISLYILEAMGI
ncbi:MAG TPA: hypothetical protein GXZ82_13520 [Firmicutes bacterium]|nr:hypothetical protein [Bacillota bacterium]